ncbi:hypothetical protein M422DRAFT_249047 [Sphaerobolus stellatus SS14]|nr:hypothetical protein M422DRAFT_249047 [Sphaerobolus stellatus SS14]
MTCGDRNSVGSWRVPTTRSAGIVNLRQRIRVMDDQPITDQRFSWTRGFDRAEAPTQASPSPSQQLNDSSSLAQPQQEDDDDVDHTLAVVTSAPSSAPVKPRKNQVHAVEWDASLDELKREKEFVEAVWDLKTRFRQAQPRLTAPKSTPGRETRKSDKLEDARHVSKPPDADGVSKPLDADGHAESVPKPTSKAELEDFLDDLLG